MCSVSSFTFQKRLGCMSFGKSKEALLRKHFPKCSEEVGTVLESKHGNYGFAYDELSGMNRKKKLNSSWNEAMLRAQTITKRFTEEEEKGFENLRQFWTIQWKDSYEGFCRVRNEVADLREVVFHGNLERSKEQETLRNLLNRMLRSNAREWFAVWGELDLHRLSPNDALDSLNRCICNWMWDEVRIISGQRAHNGDHVSKGVLFNLIHCVTGRAKPDTSKFDKRRIEDINNTRLYIHNNGIDVFYYSDGGALYLRRSEEAQKEYLKRLERPSRLSSSSRRKIRFSEANANWPQGSAWEKSKDTSRRSARLSESRRKTRSSAPTRNSGKPLPTPIRRSPRLSKKLKKPSHMK